MTSAEQTQPPALSTSDRHIFEEDPTLSLPSPSKKRQRTREDIWQIYEVERTAREVVDGGYQVVALQLPDEMVGEGVKVFEALQGELGRLMRKEDGVRRRDRHYQEETVRGGREELETDVAALEMSERSDHDDTGGGEGEERERRIRLYILADTSYSSCCVDEIAAEHVSADVVVHYGRSCLSLTARLPVIYVFTNRELDVSSIVQSFEETFPGKEEKVVLMADLPAQACIAELESRLRQNGYSQLLIPDVVHDPSSSIPNRKIDHSLDLRQYAVFHIAEPPQALLLTLQSRVKSLHIYDPETNTITHAESLKALRRRYAVLMSLTTNGVWGILINTLSVKDHLAALERVKDLIRSQGKKYYVFVVGKVNPEKVANFAEIGGWVVVGCWESSLVDMGEGRVKYWKGMITPWELEWIMSGGDGERVWDGWRGDLSGLSESATGIKHGGDSGEAGKESSGDEDSNQNGNHKGTQNWSQDSNHLDIDTDSNSESEPPEFDLRTGRFVTRSRPMRAASAKSSNNATSANMDDSKAVTRRAKGDLATINGAVSPGAEYLRSRTWMGLGSDFHETEADTRIEEGRSGIAGGYVVGDGQEKT